jgi:hypothetical protein
LYEYGGNNPIDEFDPSGFDEQAGLDFFGGVDAGLGNSVASSISGGIDFVLGPGALPPQMAKALDHPFSAGCCGDAKQGEMAGEGLGFIISFLDGGGEANVGMKVENLLKGPCFVGTTPVQMGDHTARPIRRVHAGDVVATRDPKTGRTEARRVTRTFVHHVDVVLTVRLEEVNGGLSAGCVTCTPDHPFHVRGVGFMAARLLKPGSIVDTGDGKGLKVAGVELVHQAGGYTVYNFEVEGDHTYFVGGAHDGVWVHNDCTDKAVAALKRFGGGEVWKVGTQNGWPFIVGSKENWYHDILRIGDDVVDSFANGHTGRVPFAQWQVNFDAKFGGTGANFEKYWAMEAGSGNLAKYGRLMGLP